MDTNEAEYRQKFDEIISRFENGKERYQYSATFNRVIQMLMRDVSPYEIIDHLCQMTDDVQEATIQYLRRSHPPTMLNRD